MSTAQSSATDNPTVTGLRQRVNHLGAQLDQATDHPAVKNVKAQAGNQVQAFRELLGRSPAMVRLEKRLNVDRVIIVIGGLFLYGLLVPLNFLHLAQPITTLLTFVPPMLLAARVLDQPNEQRTRLLLSYFVVFGFVQFAESLMASFLARKIPQYYTLKLVFLAYLIHPRTKGALKIYQSVLRPTLAARGGAAGARNAATPPTSNPSKSNGSSPTFGSAADKLQNPSIAKEGEETVVLPSGGGTGVGLEVGKEKETPAPSESAPAF